MVAGKSEMPKGSALGAQLVGRHPRRREALFAQQLSHQLDGRRPVSTTLDQDLKDLAFVVDSTPQIHVLACDPDDHFRRDASDRSVEDGTAAGMTEATRDTVVFDLGGSHGTG